MDKTFRTVMSWMSLLVVIFLAWHFAQIQRKEEVMAFSDLLAGLEANEVRSVRIDIGDKARAVFRVTLRDGGRARVEGIYSDSVLQSLRAAQVPFWVQSDETPAWANVLLSWAPFVLLIGFWVLFMKKAQSGGTNLDAARKAVTVRLDRAEPTVSAASLSGGAATALAELRQVVQARPPAAVLLLGASGSGKSHLLRALAADLKSPCLLADGATFAEIFMGVTAARVRDLFAQGRKEGVAFVAIDAIDDIGRRRLQDSRGDRDERTQAMLQLATSLDELGAAPKATRASFFAKKSRPEAAFSFVALTNREDLLDPAFVRRFARVITLGPPDVTERAAILAALLPAASHGFAAQNVASRAEGWTRGDLRAFVDDVVRRSAGGASSAADLDAALAAREDVRRVVSSVPT